MRVSRTRPCTPGVRTERLRKAEEFWKVGSEATALAQDESDVADAAVTLFVHSGIASSDAVCCARLGEHAQGEDHRQAVDLLRTADPGAATHLALVLSLKTKAAYSHVRVTPTELTRSMRAAEQLLELARRIARG